MIGKRLIFAALTAVMTLGTFIAAPEASARGRCDDGYGYGRRASYYGGGYRDRGYRYSSWSPRRSYYGRESSCGPRFRRPRTVYYSSYRPRRSYYAPVAYSSYRPVSRRYGCGHCGSRFASPTWLTYHRRHTAC